MSNKTLIITVVILVLAFVGVVGAARIYQNSRPNEGPADQGTNQQPSDLKFSGNSASSTPQSEQQASQSQPQPTVTGCQRDFSDSKLAANAGMNISGRQAQINVKDFGSITLEFYDKDAPKAVENFLRLSDSGYYDCLTFHRIGKDFMIQGGDPTGTGTGGQSAFGKAFEDELNPNTQSYKIGYVKGVLAMANSGPNTNGSQFFITVADNTQTLQHDYTIFGRVIAGQDVADKISNQETVDGGISAPKQPIEIESVKIIK